MTPKLTDEMRKALKNKSAQPVTVEDELTHVHYVLLPLDEYERVHGTREDSIVDEDRLKLAILSRRDESRVLNEEWGAVDQEIW